MRMLGLVNALHQMLAQRLAQGFQRLGRHLLDAETNRKRLPAISCAPAFLSSGKPTSRLSRKALHTAREGSHAQDEARCRSVTEMARRASSRLKVCEALSTLLVGGQNSFLAQQAPAVALPEVELREQRGHIAFSKLNVDHHLVLVVDIAVAGSAEGARSSRMS
ncbi:MAG: hypothetical protein U1F35_21050 [Steroidobacteraceae bacterium]